MAQIYGETVLKKNRLEKLGYIVLNKWSCEFALEKKQEAIQNYITSLGLQQGINLRDCYFGGRTNALVLHNIFQAGEKGFM